MPSVEADIHVDRAQRYLAQLCKHATAMNHAATHHRGDAGGGSVRPEVLVVSDSSADAAVLVFAQWGRCSVRAGADDVMTVRIDADDEHGMLRIQKIITADLERFGRRDRLRVIWRHCGATRQES